jgi:hypothetical protein
MEELFSNPYAGLLGQDEERIAQQARMQGLLGLASSLFEAGAPSPVRQGLGQAFGRGIQAYQQGAQGTFDQALRSMMVRQQLSETKEKRDREAAIKQAMSLPTPREQIEALRGLGAYSEIANIGAAEKTLRQSGLLRQPGEAALENPFSIYAQSDVPGVAKLGKQYQKAYESGSIDDEKATARLGELARMEESAFARQESAADRRLARDLAQGEREQKRLEGTEGQKLAAGFADRMVASEAIINQLPPDALPTEFTSLAGAVPFAGTYLQRKAMTPEQQKYKQAADNWIRANLRKESGAVIGADEMQAEYETYFPQPGDSPQVIQQKAEARKITTQAMIKNAGPVFRMPEVGQRPRPQDIRSRYNLEAPR